MIIEKQKIIDHMYNETINQISIEMSDPQVIAMWNGVSHIKKFIKETNMHIETYEITLNHKLVSHMNMVNTSIDFRLKKCDIILNLATNINLKDNTVHDYTWQFYALFETDHSRKDKIMSILLEEGIYIDRNKSQESLDKLHQILKRLSHV